MIWLIDISNHQSGFNVRQAICEGYSGVWMKATEGTTFRDSEFDGFADQVLGAGAIPGAYHYLRNGDGRGQCEVFHRRIRDHGGPEGWLAACDNEADATWQDTVDFFERWRELAGDHPLLMYSVNWWWSERGWDGVSLTPYLWDSRYVDQSGYGSVLYEGVPEAWWKSRYGGWDDVTMLQFSASGLVADSSVDVNAFRGSIDDLRVLARGGGSGGVVTPNDEGSGNANGNWSMGMSFDDFKNGTVGATPPDWMGGPRHAMRMGDWYGAVPGKLTEIHAAIDAVTRELLATKAELIKMKLGGVDVEALALALAALIPAPVVPSVEEVADKVIDEAVSRLAE